MITDYAAQLLKDQISDLKDKLLRIEERYEKKLEEQRKFFENQIQLERSEKRTLLDRFVPELKTQEYRTGVAVEQSNNGAQKEDWTLHRYPTPTDRITSAMRKHEEDWQERQATLREAARRVVEEQRERDASGGDQTEG